MWMIQIEKFENNIKESLPNNLKERETEERKEKEDIQFDSEGFYR